jgi:hypothetical protein
LRTSTAPYFHIEHHELSAAGEHLAVAKSTPPAIRQEVRAVARKDWLSVRWSRTTWFIVLLTLAAGILRVSFLGSKSLWLDEAFTAKWVGLPLGALVKFLAAAEMNMFLHYLLLHEWIMVAGSSEFSLRLPSAIFDTATVPLVYALGTALGNRRAGVFAALMMTVNATSIEHAQTARSYGMFVALATLAAVFFVRGLKRASPGTCAGYIASGTLAVYAHMFAILALPAQWLSLFLFRPVRKSAISLTICIAAIGALSLGEFFFAFSGYHHNLHWIDPLSLARLGSFFFIFAGGYLGERTWLTRSLLALYVIGTALAILRTPRAERPALYFLLLSICIPLGFIIAVSLFVTPSFMPRYLLAGLPLFALLAAFGFTRLAQSFALAMISAVSILGFAEVIHYYRAPAIQDWRGAVAFIETHSEPGDGLVVLPGYYRAPLEYYISRSRHPGTFPHIVRASDRTLIESLRKLLARSDAGTHRRVWLTCPAWEYVNEAMLRLVLHEQLIAGPELSGVRLFLLESEP